MKSLFSNKYYNLRLILSKAVEPYRGENLRRMKFMSESQSKALRTNAKTWEIFAFATRNLVPNTFIFLMAYASYLATGSYGILVAVTGVILTVTRIFDGLVDPIIAVIIDKSNGRFGRYRPIMVLGWALVALALVLLFFVGPMVGGGIIFFIAVYMIYIFGYSCFTNSANAAMTILTKDPKQRAESGRWNGLFGMVLSTAYSSVYIASYLMPKYGSVSLPLLHELCVTAIVITGIFTACTCLAISSKDRPEYYGNVSDSDDVKISDIITTLKGNRPLRLLIYSSGSNKLALLAASNASIMLMVYGIIMGDYGFRSKLSLFTFIPIMLMIFFGMGAAGKKWGKRKATIIASWGAIASAVAQFLIFLFVPTQISTNVFIMALFLIAFCLCSGFKQISTSCIYPMLADIADYELYRTGKSRAGTVTSVYTFIDNIISALATTFVSILLSVIGYTTTLPQVTDTFTPQIFTMAMVVFLGIPIVGWIISLISMKYYELTPDKMAEIQKVNLERKDTAKGKLN